MDEMPVVARAAASGCCCPATGASAAMDELAEAMTAALQQAYSAAATRPAVTFIAADLRNQSCKRGHHAFPLTLHLSLSLSHTHYVSHSLSLSLTHAVSLTLSHPHTTTGSGRNDTQSPVVLMKSNGPVGSPTAVLLNSASEAIATLLNLKLFLEARGRQSDWQNTAARVSRRSLSPNPV
jgi:hypothetical protein